MGETRRRRREVTWVRIEGYRTVEIDGGLDAGEDSDELDEEEIEDNIRSDNEIRDFFDEQVRNN
jgi:hypothetical protein